MENRGQKYPPKVHLLSGREDLNLRPHGLVPLSCHHRLLTRFTTPFRYTILAVVAISPLWIILDQLSQLITWLQIRNNQ
jgi:hypothetical protein